MKRVPAIPTFRPGDLVQVKAGHASDDDALLLWEDASPDFDITGELFSSDIAVVLAVERWGQSRDGSWRIMLLGLGYELGWTLDFDQVKTVLPVAPQVTTNDVGRHS